MRRGGRPSRRALGVLAMCALVIALVIAPGATVRAQPAASPASYDAAARVTAVAQSLAALSSLGGQALVLEAELAGAVRQRCGAGSRPPSLACTLPLARALCDRQGAAERAACAAAIDVMLVNLRSASDWVDEATRVRLLRGAADYHRALLEELMVRYAALAAELVLEEPELADPLTEPPAGALAARVAPAVRADALDRFCAGRDRRKRPPRCNDRSATCVPSLSWQRCVSALAWFVTQEATLVPAPVSPPPVAPPAAGAAVPPRSARGPSGGSR